MSKPGFPRIARIPALATRAGRVACHQGKQIEASLCALWRLEGGRAPFPRCAGRSCRSALASRLCIHAVERSPARCGTRRLQDPGRGTHVVPRSFSFRVERGLARRKAGERGGRIALAMLPPARPCPPRFTRPSNSRTGAGPLGASSRKRFGRTVAAPSSACSTGQFKRSRHTKKAAPTRLERPIFAD